MQIICRGSKLYMATINLHCNSLSQIHSSVYFRLKIVAMTGRTYMKEVVAEVFKLFDKEVNVQKESLKNNFWGSHKFPHAHKKCAMKMKVELEKMTQKMF